MNLRLLTIGLLCVLAAGCGGGSGRLSAAQYRARLAAIGHEANQAQRKVGQGLQAATVAGLSARLRTFAAADDRLGTEIEALKPPKDAEAANAALAKAEHDTAQAVRSALPQISSPEDRDESARPFDGEHGGEASRDGARCRPEAPEGARLRGPKLIHRTFVRRG